MWHGHYIGASLAWQKCVISAMSVHHWHDIQGALWNKHTNPIHGKALSPCVGFSQEGTLLPWKRRMSNKGSLNGTNTKKVIWLPYFAGQEYVKGSLCAPVPFHHGTSSPFRYKRGIALCCMFSHLSCNLPGWGFYAEVRMLWLTARCRLHPVLCCGEVGRAAVWQMRFPGVFP